MFCWMLFFFFNDTATTEIYTLSLHDALPISYLRAAPGASRASSARCRRSERSRCASTSPTRGSARRSHGSLTTRARSEEHTSELQSQSNLVCRLLLEKKKQSYTPPTTLPRSA